MKKKLFSILVMSAMLMGCNASEASSTTSTAPASKETSDTKSFVIVTNTTQKPFEYMDADGNYVGIDVDLLSAIAKDQNFTYTLKAIGFDSAMTACKNGDADGLLAATPITEEKEEAGWIFSESYYTATQCVAVLTGSEITKLEDLKGKTVAVKKNSDGESYANTIKEEYGFTVTTFEDSTSMYQALTLGQASACFEDTAVMKASIADGSLAMTIVDDSENEGVDYGFAIYSEEKQELMDLFNAGLENIKEDGSYDDILDKYLG